MRHEEIPIQVEGSAPETHLTTYILGDYLDEAPNDIRPLVLICPGGAYAMPSNREAEPVALQFNAMGYHAAILRYSCAPAVFPTSLLEVAASVKYIREHAKAWRVSPDKILIMGFSAGGHLAASYGVFWDEKFVREAFSCTRELLQPNGLILCYPVISADESIAHVPSLQNLLGEQYEAKKEEMSLEKQVGEQVPETFLWHTFEDKTVPFWNSFRFAEALGRAGIPLEYHLYPTGEHGLSLAVDSIRRKDGSGSEKGCESWFPLLKSWLLRKFGL